jgi:hypothetical protein
MERAPADRLMAMCQKHSPEISALWYKAVIANPKTPSLKLMSKDGALRHASAFYKQLGEMYFSEDCFAAVRHVLDVDGFVEDFFTRGIPLEEVLYTLIMLRRHIWTFADAEAIYSPIIIDMYSAVESLNRIILIFDYASYITAKRYRELSQSCKPLLK